MKDKWVSFWIGIGITIAFIALMEIASSEGSRETCVALEAAGQIDASTPVVQVLCPTLKSAGDR